MKVRIATTNDYNTILEMYSIARKYMKDNGNEDQWGTTYPPRDMIQRDIASGNCFIEENDEGICGVFCFFVGEDKTYKEIKDGKWLNSKPYGTIHRVAGNGKTKGVLKCAVDYCKCNIANLRIDTHHNNITMQNAIKKCGFQRCGIIRAEDGGARIAYQLSE